MELRAIRPICLLGQKLTLMDMILVIGGSNFEGRINLIKKLKKFKRNLVFVAAAFVFLFIHDIHESPESRKNACVF